MRGRGELTVLDGVAVIPSRVALECLFDRRDEDLSSLIAVAVAVDGEPGPVEDLDDVGDLVGRHQPQAVLGVPGRRVEVVGPGESGGEALDRAVDDQLDDAEAELVVGRVVAELHDPPSDVLGGSAVAKTDPATITRVG